MFYCGSEEGPVVRHLEIPQWMFDPEACCRMPLAGAPIVGCDALLDLKELLRSVPRQQRDIVLRTPHHPLGGADAKITEPTEGHSARTVSGVAEGPRRHELPRETREKTTQLLARLLREHGTKTLACRRRREAWDE